MTTMQKLYEKATGAQAPEPAVLAAQIAKFDDRKQNVLELRAQGFMWKEIAEEVGGAAAPTFCGFAKKAFQDIQRALT